MAYTTQASPFGSGPLGSVTLWVRRLLMANAGVFLFSVAFGLPVANDWLAFHPSQILTRPWGVFTYMFAHGGLWHLLGNLVVIFFFGPGLERRWGSNAFIRYYIGCGLGAVVLSLIFQPASVIGASGAAYGLMLAFAMAWPEAIVNIWGVVPVKVKWLVGFMGAMSVASAIGPARDGVAHFAHLGGLAAGFAFIRFGWVTQWGSVTKRPQKKRRMAVVPGILDKEVRQAKRQEKEAVKERETLDAVDAVLDKISAQGIGSLSDDERALLDRVSKKQRTN